ncbi:MAG: sugar phosphate isomerase/epimerase family protein [Actinomycetota bacterium]
MKLSCQEHLIPGESLVQKWEHLQSWGYDAIELHGHGDFVFRARLDELQAARRAGVAMPTVCVIMDHFIGDFDAGKRRDAIENMKSLLSVMSEIGGEGAITPASYGMFSRRLPPYEPPRTEAEDRAVLVEGLTELGEHAGREGVRVYLEPLNRYEDHMVNSLAQAVELGDEVGLDSVKVMGDLFHMNLEEDDPPASIRAAGGHLRHVHLADSNRAHPGTGHVDFAGALAALRDIGFDGYMALECGLRGDASMVLPEVARYLRGLGPTAPA